MSRTNTFRTASFFRRATLVAVVGVTLAAGAASATPVTTTVTTSNTGFAVSGNDLINGRSGVVVGNLNSEESLGSNTTGSALTDGGFGSVSIASGSNPGLVQIHAGTTITYTLPTTVAGFAISTINSYSGWRDTGRYQQDYDVWFAFASDPTLYVDMFTVAAHPSSGIDAMASTGGLNGALLADHVVGVRFDFANVQNGFVGYRELDVIGVASVPEPASLLLFGLGALALAGVRRKVARG